MAEGMTADEESMSAAGLLCPVCLKEDLPLTDKAVVNPCMHVFCEDCLQNWMIVRGNDLCPICKGQATSFFCDIQESGAYKEREVRPKAARPDELYFGALDSDHSVVGAAIRRGVALTLRDHAYHPATLPPSSYEIQPPYSRRRRERPWVDEVEYRSWRIRRRSDNQPPHLLDQNSITPYSQRLSNLMASRFQRDMSQTRYQFQPREHWRLHIYHMNWRAESPVSGASRPNYNSSQSRLEEWLRRELVVVSGAPGTPVQIMYMVSRVRSAGLLGGRRQATDGLGELTEAERRSLQDIKQHVGEHAEHFWHEIRCFQASRLNLQAYDNAVQYRNAAGDHVGSGESIQNTLTAEDVRESRMGARQRRAPGETPPFVWEPDLHRSTEPIQLDLEDEDQVELPRNRRRSQRLHRERLAHNLQSAMRTTGSRGEGLRLDELERETEEAQGVQRSLGDDGEDSPWDLDDMQSHSEGQEDQQEVDRDRPMPTSRQPRHTGNEFASNRGRASMGVPGRSRRTLRDRLSSPSAPTNSVSTRTRSRRSSSRPRRSRWEPQAEGDLAAAPQAAERRVFDPRVTSRLDSEREEVRRHSTRLEATPRASRATPLQHPMSQEEIHILASQRLQSLMSQSNGENHTPLEATQSAARMEGQQRNPPPGNALDRPATVREVRALDSGENDEDIDTIRSELRRSSSNRRHADNGLFGPQARPQASLPLLNRTGITIRLRSPRGRFDTRLTFDRRHRQQSMSQAVIDLCSSGSE